MNSSPNGANGLEDYAAMSYLKDFINTLSMNPSIFDTGVEELTRLVNHFLDEDECVLELIVNQCIDQVFEFALNSHIDCGSVVLVNRRCRFPL